jgi:hypothetical protein
MATLAEPGMSRTSDWVFNFDDPDSIDLDDTLLNDSDVLEDSDQLNPDLANSDIGSVCGSAAASEEEFVIPPDTQVRHPSAQLPLSFTHASRLHTICAKTLTEREISRITTQMNQAITTLSWR